MPDLTGGEIMDTHPHCIPIVEVVTVGNLSSSCLHLASQISLFRERKAHSYCWRKHWKKVEDLAFLHPAIAVVTPMTMQHQEDQLPHPQREEHFQPLKVNQLLFCFTKLVV